MRKMRGTLGARIHLRSGCLNVRTWYAGSTCPDSLIPSNGDTPRAPCPRCMENGDHSPKQLLYVEGITQGSYHSDIPATYFAIPPFRLDKRGPGFEALRFQYISLVRFGLKTQEKLEKALRKLQHWEDRRAAIVQSLGQVSTLKDALVTAGRQLLSVRQDRHFVEDLFKAAGVDILLLNGGDQRYTEQQLHQAWLSESITSARDTGLPRHSATAGEALASASAAELAQLSENIGAGSKRPSSATGEAIVGNDHPAKKRQAELGVGINTSPQRMSRACKCPNIGGLGHELMPPPPSPNVALRSPQIEYLKTQNQEGGHDYQHFIRRPTLLSENTGGSDYLSLPEYPFNGFHYQGDRRVGLSQNGVRNTWGPEAIETDRTGNKDKQKLRKFGSIHNPIPRSSSNNPDHLAFYVKQGLKPDSRANLEASRATVGRPSPANSPSRIHDLRRLEPPSIHLWRSRAIRTPGLSRHMRSSTSNSSQLWPYGTSTASGSYMTPMSSPHFQMQRDNLTSISGGVRRPQPGRLYLEQMKT